MALRYAAESVERMSLWRERHEARLELGGLEEGVEWVVHLFVFLRSWLSLQR